MHPKEYILQGGWQLKCRSMWRGIFTSKPTHKVNKHDQLATDQVKYHLKLRAHFQSQKIMT
jgi:hypothetical protein